MLTLVTIAILAVVLADMHENTTTSYALAASQRDQLRAEYLARSAINLTRLLTSQRDGISRAAAPLLQLLTRRPSAGKLPVWLYANQVLQPFCDYEAAQAQEGGGIDFGAALGLGETGGRCEVVAFAENSRINVNNPLAFTGDSARSTVAMQVYGLIGGYQQPSPYDPLFESRDADELITSRLDIVSALIDWWDYDTQRTVFDPGALTVSNTGTEDEPYQRFRDAYRIKNAPFDSLEELRMIRGVGDDFWATFVEPDPEDPTSRSITIYGSGRISPNEAKPEVLLAQTCSIVPTATLCQADQAARFIQLLSTVRAIAPIPWFLSHQQYFDFLQGRGQPTDLYPMLQAMLGQENPLLFTPITLTQEQQQKLGAALVFSSEIIFVEATGLVGNCDGEGAGRCTRTKIRSVLNFDPRWTPPPPNAGAMTGLGIFHYWRME